MTTARRHRAVSAVACLIVAAAGVVGPAASTGGADPIRYRLTFPEAEHRAMDVTVEFSQVDGPLELRMSRSSPGRYALHEFARHMVGLRADDGGGRELALTQTAPHAWRVEEHPGTVRVTYRMFGDRLDGTYLAIDATHAHINAPAAFAWARGLEDRPVTITLVPPPDTGWRVATQLFPTADPWTFTAPGLAYLLDSPIEASRHLVRSITARLPAGTPGPAPRIDLALHHAGGDAEVDAFVADLEAIVAEQAVIFGEYPAFEGQRYTFLADYLPWAVGDGMEHRNSTVLTSSAGLAGARTMLASTAAHEFFHAWNVERIRPRSLEPFDFESYNMSGELWLAEGVTSYYEALVMHRAGLTTLDEAVAGFSGAVSAVLSSPAPAVRSPEEMSRFALFVDGPGLDRTSGGTTYLSYYTVGHAVGLGLDLAIREHTGTRGSLDDVFRWLWARHGRPGGSPVGSVARPYTPTDVRDAIAFVTDGTFADAFMQRHVHGCDAIDYARLVSQAGLQLRPRAAGRASLGVVGFERAANRLIVAAPPSPGSPLHRAGLGVGDTLGTLAGRRISQLDDLFDALRDQRPGDRVPLRFVRRGETEPRTASITLIEQPDLEIVTLEASGQTPSPAQMQFRRGWLGRRGLD